MAATQEEYEILLRARDELTGVLKRAGASSVAEFRKLHSGTDLTKTKLEKVTAAAAHFFTSFRNRGRQVVSFLRRSWIPTIALVAGGILSLGTIRTVTADARDFQVALGEVATILPDTASGVADLRRQVLDLAVAQNQNQTVVAKGLYQTISAGISDTADALQLLKVASELGTAGLADTNETVDLLTTTLNAYRRRVDDAQQISDVFFGTVRLGKTTISELAGSIGQALPLASALGVGLEQVTGGLATLTQEGFNTAESVTSLRALFKSLLTRTTEIDAVFQRAGKRFDLTTTRSIGLAEVLRTLRENLKDDAEAMDVLGGRLEATNALLGLTGGNFGAFRDILDELQASAGATDKALQKILGQDAFVVTSALATIRKEAITLGDAILEALRETIDKFGGLTAVQATLQGGFTALKPLVKGVTESVAEAALQFVNFTDNVELAFLRTERLVDAIRDVGGALSKVLPDQERQRRRGLEAALATGLPGSGLTDAQGVDLGAVRERLLLAQGAFRRANLLAHSPSTSLRPLEEREKLLEDLSLAEFRLANAEEAAANLEARTRDAARKGIAALDHARELAEQADAARAKAREDRLKRIAELEHSILVRQLADQAARENGVNAADFFRPGQRPRGIVESVQGLSLEQLRDAGVGAFHAIQAAASEAAGQEGAGRLVELFDLAVNFEERLAQQRLINQTRSAAEVENTERDLGFRERMLALQEQLGLEGADALALEQQRTEVQRERLRAALDETNLLAKQKDALLALFDFVAGSRSEGLANAPFDEIRSKLAGQLKELADAKLDEAQAINASFHALQADIAAKRDAGELTDEQANKLRDLNEQLREQKLIVAESDGVYEAAGDALKNAFADTTTKLVVDFIEGTKSAKEAFQDFGRAVVQQLEQIAARILVVKGLNAAFNLGLTYEKGGVIPGGLTNIHALAKGGLVAGGLGHPMPVTFAAAGGVFGTPQLAVIGEGKNTEAVVPLPDNRSVPVKFQGAPPSTGPTVQVTVQQSFQLLDTKSLKERVPEIGGEIAQVVTDRLSRDLGLRAAVRGVRS